MQLNTGTPGGVPQAERSRGDDIPPTTVTAIGVRPFKETVRRPGGPSSPIVKRELVVAVECWAAAVGAQTVDQALDPLLEWVTAALAGSNLNGLVHAALEAEIQWDAERKDSQYGKATVFLVAHYQTLIGDATSAA